MGRLTVSVSSRGQNHGRAVPAAVQRTTSLGGGFMAESGSFREERAPMGPAALFEPAR